MRSSRVLACLAAVAVLCACGTSSSSSSSSASSSASPSTSPSATCQFTSDSVSPTGTVEIQPQGQAPHPITATVTLPCYSFLRVGNSGKADATFVTFSSHSACDLSQNAGSSSLAVLWTREPVPADYLFELAAGNVACTFYQPLRRVNLCGTGTMSVQGAATVTAQCKGDPGFQVSVQAGLVLVTYLHGSMVLASGHGLIFDPLTDEATPTSAAFSSDEQTVFRTQLREIRPTPIAQTIAFKSSAPTTVRPNDTYQVSATGGASGNAVMLTIDSSSTSVCSISSPPANFTSDGVVSSATVTFTAAGTCTIDANQAGNALYQAALQQQQAIQIVSPIS